MSDGAPEADRAPGAPHPRYTTTLLGQAEAEAAFLDAFNAGRLHHAWLITGPQGVGKATLAWKIARFLLATPIEEDGLFGAPPKPESLAIAPEHPIMPRIDALSEPRLFVLRRPFDDKTERLRAEITVDEVRRMKNYFALSAADGGRRVAIVDAADELNVNAANALLKLLEEPPDDTIILLISHQPSRLLPTIISRCRTLRCRQLPPNDIATILERSGVDAVQSPEALAALSGGSAGTALRLIHLEGPTLYAQILQIIDKGDRQAALALAESCTGRTNTDRFALVLDLFDIALSRLARAGVAGPPSPEAAPNEAALMARLSPNDVAARRWANLHQEIGARTRHGKAVNLDPAALILDIVFKIADVSAGRAA